MQLLLLEDKQVIETLTPHTPRKRSQMALARGVVIRCFQDLDAAGCCYARETGSKLAVTITNKILRPFPKGVASRSCCAVQASVGERVTPT